MLERPAILIDEDRAEYCDLFEMICDEEHPRTLKEWILVVDIAYAEWEIFRLRGLKVRTLHTALTWVGHKEVNPGVKGAQPQKWHTQFRKLVVGVLARDASSKLSMTETLGQYGLTLESLVASAFGQTISTQSSADRLVDAAYQRRRALYADLERVRSKAPNDLPAKVVESPSVAPSDGATGAHGEAHEEVVDDGAGSQPSTPDEGHS
jgi:hypothetical protein